jgi:hypothetical protein
MFPDLRCLSPEPFVVRANLKGWGWHAAAELLFVACFFAFVIEFGGGS